MFANLCKLKVVCFAAIGLAVGASLTGHTVPRAYAEEPIIADLPWEQQPEITLTAEQLATILGRLHTAIDTIKQTPFDQLNTGLEYESLPAYQLWNEEGMLDAYLCRPVFGMPYSGDVYNNFCGGLIKYEGMGVGVGVRVDHQRQWWGEKFHFPQELFDLVVEFRTALHRSAEAYFSTPEHVLTWYADHRDEMLRFARTLSNNDRERLILWFLSGDVAGFAAAYDPVMREQCLHAVAAEERGLDLVRWLTKPEADRPASIRDLMQEQEEAIYDEAFDGKFGPKTLRILEQDAAKFAAQKFQVGGEPLADAYLAAYSDLIDEIGKLHQ